jgi:hypothetical protein
VPLSEAGRVATYPKPRRSESATPPPPRPVPPRLLPSRGARCRRSFLPDNAAPSRSLSTCRSKSCLKYFIAIALPGPSENVSLWPLSSSTAKLTLSSSSTVSHRPRSACSGCRSPHPPPFCTQDRRALVREDLAPRATQSRPRHRSLRPRAPPRTAPSSVTFRSRLRVHEFLQVTVCLAGSLTSTSTTPPLTSPASASD